MEIMNVLQEHNRAWNAHDAAKVASFYADDCVMENAASGEVVKGREGVRVYHEGSFATNPDIKVEMKNVFVSGNWSASELVMSGTNTGRGLSGGPPTGKSFSVRVCRIAEYQGDLIKRTTVYLDMVTMLKQLGTLPAAPEDYKAVVRRVIEEAWNKGDLAVVNEVVAPDYIFRVAAGQEYKGPEGLAQSVRMYRTAMPDFHITISDILAEGDRVACRFTVQGTFTGELMGIAPTGKRFTSTGAVFIRFVGGKEVEALEFLDQLSMFQQLGVTPPMGQPAT
jgi:steroid delta-isomerase-like uncharacterized protein